MQLPNQVSIKSIDVTQFQICYFRDLNHSPDSPPHNYVSIPLGNNLALCLCIITTKYEKLYEKYQNTGFEADLNSLIYLDTDAFPFLKAERGCVINCNLPEVLSDQKLQKRIDPDIPFEIRANDMNFPDHLKKQICTAILSSRQVKGYIKEYIRNSTHLNAYLY